MPLYMTDCIQNSTNGASPRQSLTTRTPSSPGHGSEAPSFMVGRYLSESPYTSGNGPNWTLVVLSVVTDFFTKDSDGSTLIEVARMYNDAEVLEYLIERNKINSLKVISAHNVARYVENKDDVEALEIPETVRQFSARFLDDDE